MKERLSQGERELLWEVATSISKGREIVSACAYGSKVAGYARPDSDYDIIVALKKFRPRVRYRYIKEPADVSALVVDEKGVQDDAERASLGEFVAGRLLNVYEPITDDGFFRRAEVDYKRRVALEGLLELAADNGEFAQDLIIPFDYLLFDKLHKRAFVYPPAFYSYVRTYTCSQGKENRAVSVEGFREAAASLEEEGIVTIESDAVRIRRDKMKGSAFSRFLALFNLTTRGVAQYAVHGYAGQVGLGVFKNETFSKLRRMREKVEPPPELQNPRVLLRLDEGRVFGSSGDVAPELARAEGFTKYTHHEKNLGEVYSTRRLLTIAGPKQVKYVVKHFADIRSIKWALVGAWAASMRFSMSPQARLHREYAATRALREHGINTPRIVGVAVADRVLVTEYIEGTTLTQEIELNLREKTKETESIFSYGRTLALVHRAGFALGDAKASNIVIKDGHVYFTDLEQAVEGGDATWDIAEFLYYTAKLSMKEDGMRRVGEAFLRGYTQEGGKEVVARAASAKYLAPFRPFITPQMTRMIREFLQTYSK